MALGPIVALVVAVTPGAPAMATPLDPRPTPSGDLVVEPAALVPPPGTTTLISRRPNGALANGESRTPSISASGRWVAFASAASNIVPNDTNGAMDVFLHDRRNGRTIRLPGPGGVPIPPGASATEPSIAGDASIVAFTYLAAPSTNVTVFIPPAPVVVAWVRATGAVEAVSVAPDGSLARGSGEASASGDGRLVAFTSIWPAEKEDTLGQPDVFVRDRVAGTTTVVSVTPDGRVGRGGSQNPAISRDGRIVAFASDAEDLVLGDDNGETDIFVRDLLGGVTTHVSVAPSGQSNGPSTDPAISSDGSVVVFESSASNLAEGVPDGTRAVYWRDLPAGTTAVASVGLDGTVVPGTSGQAAISDDGRVVAFASTVSDLTASAGGGSGGTTGGAGASNAVVAAVIDGRTEVYVREMILGETVRVSVGTDGGPGRTRSVDPVISEDGRFVAFASESSRLVAGDDNQVGDVFVRELPAVATLSPPVVDFGWRGIGSVRPPEIVTLTNDGWAPLTGRLNELSGAAAADFSIVGDGCLDTVLHRGSSCTITVAFDPTAEGVRNAALLVGHSADGSPGPVRLIGRGSLARIELDPPLGRPGIVTVATGSGFPPETEVRLEWDRGITPLLPVIVTDADGGFSIGVLVFHNDIRGERALMASPTEEGPFPPFQIFDTPFFVVTPSGQPPRFIDRFPFGEGRPPLVMRR